MDVSLPQSTPDPWRADRLVRLIFWTSAAGRQLRRCLDSIADAAGLSDGEVLTIWLCLAEDGGLVQGELATALGISPAQMSGIVERLRQRGLIEMHRQALDRRRQVWRGTAAGRHILDSLAEPLANLAQRLDKQLPPGQQDSAASLGERLASAAQAWPDAPDHSAPGNMTDRADEGSTRKAA